jgi:hypothetical protein
MQPADPIQSVPEPLTIRARLAQLMREKEVLLALLRVSEKKRELLSTVDASEGAEGWRLSRMS